MTSRLLGDDSRAAVDFLQEIVREHGWHSLRVGDGVAQSLLTRRQP